MNSSPLKLRFEIANLYRTFIRVIISYSKSYMKMLRVVKNTMLYVRVRSFYDLLTLMDHGNNCHNSDYVSIKIPNGKEFNY